MPSVGGQASTSVPPFVIKLYDLVTQPETDGIVCWGSTGNSFLLLDTRLFSQLVLPMHFKHDNLRSFERQLNIYGFQRCIAQPTEHALEFFHPKFRRDQRDLLLEIKRSQPARKRQLSADAPSAPGSTLAMDEASALNALQETMTEIAAGAEVLVLQATAPRQPPGGFPPGPGTLLRDMTRRLSGKGACRGLGAALSMAALVWGPPFFLPRTGRPAR